jgi:hypothetical protein
MICSDNDYYDYYYSITSYESKTGTDNAINLNNCIWNNNDPVIYNMRTKLGVGYEGGHWFHMAENFMVQHSILRHDGMLTNASNVYYNFDKDGFINELNGVTKMIISLGTIGTLLMKEKIANYIYFNSKKDQDIASTLQYGQTFTIKINKIKEHLIEDLSPSIDTEKRFVMNLDKTYKYAA